MSNDTLVKSQGDHHNLICYRKAELIYDITYHFANSVFKRGDRTIDQMVQAARSGKQNIVEGNADIDVSVEMGIRLIGIAKSSLRELLADYEDYLRVNGFEKWSITSKEYIAMRRLGSKNDNNDYILNIAKSRAPNVVANMAIILLRQEDYLLHQFIATHSNRFMEEGGFKEKMYRVRVAQRDKKQ